MNRATVDTAHLAWTITLATTTQGEKRAVGRMLLRSLIAEITGSDPARVELTAQCPDCGGPHGRPDVVAPGGLYASVAHCAEGTIVAVAPSPVGIDVELLVDATGRAKAINEVAGASTDPLRHWTRVEAVLKADGRGLRVDPRTVIVTDDQAELDSRRFRLSEPDVNAGWVVSVAVAEELAATSVAPRRATSRRRTR